MDFKVTQNKSLSDVVSNGIFQPTFKKLPFVKFGIGIKKENYIHNYLKILVQYCPLF